MKSVLVLALLLLASCKSPAGEEADSTASAADPIECICGTPDADLVGCHCELCVSGGGNPENPRCTCLPLVVGDGGEE